MDQPHTEEGSVVMVQEGPTKEVALAAASIAQYLLSDELDVSVQQVLLAPIVCHDEERPVGPQWRLVAVVPEDVFAEYLDSLQCLQIGFTDGNDSEVTPATWEADRPAGAQETALATLGEPVGGYTESEVLGEFYNQIAFPRPGELDTAACADIFGLALLPEGWTEAHVAELSTLERTVQGCENEEPFTDLVFNILQGNWDGFKQAYLTFDPNTNEFMPQS